MKHFIANTANITAVLLAGMYERDLEQGKGPASLPQARWVQLLIRRCVGPLSEVGDEDSTMYL